MIFQDDRTPEQRKIPHVIILATDRFMSGWGGAEDGPSYVGWAAPADNYNDTLCWVEKRGEMMRVRIVSADYRPPAGPGHCHIYASRLPQQS